MASALQKHVARRQDQTFADGGLSSGRGFSLPNARVVEMDWPADKFKRRAVSALVPYARNARTHSEAQVAQIAASITVYLMLTSEGRLGEFLIGTSNQSEVLRENVGFQFSLPPPLLLRNFLI